MSEQAKRVSKNVSGPWLVRDKECLLCELCVHEAPGLMTCDDTEGNWGCYFTKQPTTPKEEEQALNAYESCCIGAVDYEGDDPAIRCRVADIDVRWNKRKP